MAKEKGKKSGPTTGQPAAKMDQRARTAQNKLRNIARAKREELAAKIRAERRKKAKQLEAEKLAAQREAERLLAEDPSLAADPA